MFGAFELSLNTDSNREQSLEIYKLFLATDRRNLSIFKFSCRGIRRINHISASATRYMFLKESAFGRSIR
jgi:hypothetical protein